MELGQQTLRVLVAQTRHEVLALGHISLGRIQPYLDAIQGGHSHVEEDSIEYWQGDVLK